MAQTLTRTDDKALFGLDDKQNLAVSSVPIDLVTALTPDESI
jgi:hypothetical protein